MVLAYSTLGHEIYKHAIYKGLNSKKGESTLTEVRTTVERGFPLYGLPLWLAVVVLLLILAAFVAYSVAGKGQGSHAGREEVRRSYRRELAKQMARQDAEKIKSGEKVRRKWMQW